MRKIDSIIVHCSATKAGQDFTAADIDQNGEAVALKVVVHSHRIVRVVHLHQRLPHEELPFTSPDCWA